jgi:hypothetical protein
MSRPVKWAVAGLVALTVIRLTVAALIPLAPDEAYYWVWSRALAPGYLDHPPMVALWIRAGTMLAGANELGVRLLGPFSAALGSVMLYDAAERLFPARNAGMTAAVLLNATLAVGAGAVIMTPDTPLLLFWTATLWAGARIATGEGPGWWLAAGLFAGLSLTSKYTGAFLPIGLGLFALIAMPGSRRRPEPWLGLLIAGLLFTPVVLWNFHNDWVGFLRQGGRVGDWRPERAVGFLAELVGGQIGLATPGVFVLFVAGIVMAVRATVRSRDPAWCLLAALSVPPALVFLQHALGDRVQGNWPIVIYPAAAIAASGLVAPIWRRLLWRRLVGPSAGIGFAVSFVVYAYAVSAWPAIPGGRDPLARQLFGWNELASAAEIARQRSNATFIAAEPYATAAQLAWALPSHIQVLGVGDHWLPTTLPKAEGGEAQGILIRPERYGAPEPALWRDVTPLPAIERTSGTTVIERYSVSLVRPVPGQPIGAWLPHR